MLAGAAIHWFPMRKHLLLAALLALIAVCGNAQAKSPASTEAQLIQMEHDWAKALTTKDIATLDRLIAADWTSVNPAGQVKTKAMVLNGLKAAEKPQESAVLTDVKAKVFGASALVTGVAVEKSTIQGEEREGRYRFMDLFVKRNGQWVAVYTQTTKIVE
jgi:ketosteroid isomerase-like protein